MKNSNSIKLMIFAMLLVSQMACAGTNNQNADKDMVKKEFSVTAFSEIDSEIVGNIEVVQSPQTSVTAEGKERLVENLKIWVEEGELKLEMKDRLRFKKWKGSRPKLTVYISTPELSKVSSEGVGNIKLKSEIKVSELKIDSEGVGNISADNITAGFIKVESDGVGNIALKGSADNLEIESEGVGNINTRDLKAQHVKVSSEGVGNISCYASGSIDIKSEGVGNVSYYGNPELKTIIKNGVGRVSGK